MATRSDCPINHAVEILGDKWTLLVLRDIVFEGKNRFSELANMREGIATNLLSDRLKKLESAGILERVNDPQDGRQFEYLMTRTGEALIPLLLEMMVWSSAHTDDVNISKTLVSQIKKDRDGIVEMIVRGLRG